MCDLDCWNEVYYQLFTLSAFTHSDRFVVVVCCRMSTFGYVWVDTRTLDLHVTLTSFEALYW